MRRRLRTNKMGTINTPKNIMATLLFLIYLSATATAQTAPIVCSLNLKDRMIKIKIEVPANNRVESRRKARDQALVSNKIFTRLVNSAQMAIFQNRWLRAVSSNFGSANPGDTRKSDHR